jgi:type IV fimbrial biogenesis protein FimT
MEAIKRNAYTQFCSDSSSSNTTDTLGTACGSNSGMVFVQLGPATTSTVFAAPPDLQMPIQLHGHINAIRFHGDGLGYAPGSTTPYSDTSGTSGTSVVDVCTASLKSNNHIMVQLTTGTIITSTSYTGTCP